MNNLKKLTIQDMAKVMLTQDHSYKIISANANGSKIKNEIPKRYK